MGLGADKALIFPFLQNVAISDDIDGSPISYNITYSDVTSGRICGTFSIPAATCQDGVCRHTSQITFPCLPSDDITLSVLSTNILGSGPPSQSVVFSLIADSDHSEFYTPACMKINKDAPKILASWPHTLSLHNIMVQSFE